MNIKETFLSLTTKTYPHGSEHQLIPFLPEGCEMDEVGNYFIKIGESDTLFTCHLDTCSSIQEDVCRVIGSTFIKSDGETILGADDKAGMTVLLYMIENKVPGLYYFFVGEEVGCVGSSDASMYLDFSGYNKCISFDRRGYDSVVTDQFYGTCCSDDFAYFLANELNSKHLSFNFSPDPTGVMTDSASFMDIIPECTNISVGYFNEHRVTEEQNIIFLQNLCEACVKVDWENLPIVRDPESISYKKDVKTYSTYDDFDDFDDSIDSSIITVLIDDQMWNARLSQSRLLEERGHITNWAIRQGVYYNLRAVNWDGRSCSIEYNNQTEYLGEREDMIYLIDQLSEVDLEDLDLLEIC